MIEILGSDANMRSCQFHKPTDAVPEGTVQKRKPALMEFHVSRQARDRYQFDESLFSLSGNVILANFYAARVFAQKMNDKRDLVSFPEQPARESPGDARSPGLVVRAYWPRGDG